MSASQEEYRIKSQKLINDSSAPDYLHLADKWFTHEENYCENMLQPETKPKLMKRVEQEVISKHAKTIVEKSTGCKHMIEQKKNDELKLMYKCFVREETNLGQIIFCLRDYIGETGTKYVNEKELNEKPEQLV